MCSGGGGVPRVQSTPHLVRCFTLQRNQRLLHLLPSTVTQQLVAKEEKMSGDPPPLSKIVIWLWFVGFSDYALERLVFMQFCRQSVRRRPTRPTPSMHRRSVRT